MVPLDSRCTIIFVAAHFIGVRKFFVILIFFHILYSILQITNSHSRKWLFFILYDIALCTKKFSTPLKNPPFYAIINP